MTIDRQAIADLDFSDVSTARKLKPSCCLGFTIEGLCDWTQSPMPKLHLPFAASKYPDIRHFHAPL